MILSNIKCPQILITQEYILFYISGKINRRHNVCEYVCMCVANPIDFTVKSFDSSKS